MQFKDLKFVPKYDDCNSVDKLQVESFGLKLDGRRARVFFPNGYGASVIDDGYGSEDGLYEIAVLKGSPENSHLCYDSGLTDDVIGRCTPEEIEDYLKQIEGLPHAKP